MTVWFRMSAGLAPSKPIRDARACTKSPAETDVDASRLVSFTDRSTEGEKARFKIACKAAPSNWAKAESSEKLMAPVRAASAVLRKVTWSSSLRICAKDKGASLRRRTDTALIPGAPSAKGENRASGGIAGLRR